MIKLEDKSHCCGCNSCGEVCPVHAISFSDDNEGFWYPITDISTCINCGLCERVCPCLHKNNARTPLLVKAGRSNNQEVCLKSSSGGFFTELALSVLDIHGVVAGATFDEEWKVKHILVDKKSDLHLLRGSKYVQSRLFGIFGAIKEKLDSGKEVLFTGTPCQVNGLKNYLRKEYNNLLCVEVICHGVPSPMVWTDYLQTISEDKVLESICFRDKRQGWFKYGFNAKYLNNKEFYERRDKNLYLKGYLTDVFLRPSCYNCPSKEGRSYADITLGHYWGVRDLPSNAFVNDGISVALIYSAKGQYYFNRINVNCFDAEYDDVCRNNAMMINSTPLPSDRNQFWKDYHKRGVVSIKHAIKRREPGIFKRILGLVIYIFKQVR